VHLVGFIINKSELRVSLARRIVGTVKSEEIVVGFRYVTYWWGNKGWIQGFWWQAYWKIYDTMSNKMHLCPIHALSCDIE
jgi:hypothetical protein